jgi:DNA-binding MarR family transcriptional regulator
MSNQRVKNKFNETLRSRNSSKNITSPLEHLFGSKTRARILNLFFANPSKSFYLREIARRIDVRLNSVRREIKNLRRYDIVLEENHSSSDLKRFFILNTNSLLYPELRALILKGNLFLENDLAKTISKIGSVSLILLGGVFVDDKDAQTDILIVGQLSNDKVEKIIRDFEKKLGFEIRYTLMSKSEYKYRKLVGDKFLYSVLESKHIVALDRQQNLEEPEK